MKLSSLFFKARGAILLLLGVATLAVSLDASAIPVFARQTGFKCVACHVGGEYPQLTSLGRYFKLTGYTQGDAKDFWNLTTNIDRSPFAVWLQAARQWTTNNSTDINAGGTGSRFDAQTLSLFAGGKITQTRPRDDYSLRRFYGDDRRPVGQRCDASFAYERTS